ncbi:DnaD domain-containing protein [Lentibacillus jeotgali]|uniref:DnaD domain-containing protein n=1 Tax=Lentibacillus jeotgali TaxID=558169 RepID=UPI00026287DD|nr:DnaD domain protein [Lentibacillus jeotgali]
MNYLKEINAFYNQIIFNPLSGSAVSLWNTLMHFNNLCGWQETFSVPASAIELKSGVKGTSFKRAREELQQTGYIHVTPGSGNQAATYRMISQVKPMYQSENVLHIEQDTQPVMEERSQQPQTAETPQTRPQMNTTNETSASVSYNSDCQPSISHTEETPNSVAEDNTMVYRADQTLEESTVYSMDHNMACNVDHSTDPLIKQYINKNKTKHKPTTTTTDAIQFYRKNFGVASSYVADDISNWINDMGDPLVLDAMKRALEQGKATWRYVKGILKSWETKGIMTVEQATADDSAFRARQKNRMRATDRREVVPEWFKEQKRKQALEREQKEASSLPDRYRQSAEREECERLLAKFSKKKVGGVG